ncbi:ABC transporter permease [Salinicola sp. 4072]|jgi:peptide/nickel transport system permease protein|uniref:ABC transporter permease n=1 Tax=Salinicola sp. 4072 TaxID=3082157 RepID=UPI002FC61A20
MFSYILRRVLYTIPIALGVTVICFLLVQLGPGDPINALLPEDATQEMIDQVKAEYGLDKPLPVQYATWLGHALTGDLGTSIATGRSVSTEIFSALGNTLMLAFGGMLVSFVVGLTLGSIAGSRQGTLSDRVVTGFAVTGVSVPHYWIAIVLVAIFAVGLHWLPAMGMGPRGSTGFALDWAHIQHFVLPIFALSLIPTGIIARSVRGSVSETYGQDFVQTLRAKGMPERQVFVHVARNACSAAIAVMGLQMAELLGGSILIETVFVWPGTGQLLNNAIFMRDLPILQGTILIMALIFVATNLVADILQTLLDPRIRR